MDIDVKKVKKKIILNIVFMCISFILLMATIHYLVYSSTLYDTAGWIYAPLCLFLFSLSVTLFVYSTVLLLRLLNKKIIYAVILVIYVLGGLLTIYISSIPFNNSQFYDKLPDEQDIKSYIYDEFNRNDELVSCSNEYNSLIYDRDKYSYEYKLKCKMRTSENIYYDAQIELKRHNSKIFGINFIYKKTYEDNDVVKSNNYDFSHTIGAEINSMFKKYGCGQYGCFDENITFNYDFNKLEDINNSIYDFIELLRNKYDYSASMLGNINIKIVGKNNTYYVSLLKIIEKYSKETNLKNLKYALYDKQSDLYPIPLIEKLYINDKEYKSKINFYYHPRYNEYIVGISDFEKTEEKLIKDIAVNYLNAKYKKTLYNMKKQKKVSFTINNHTFYYITEDEDINSYNIGTNFTRHVTKDNRGISINIIEPFFEYDSHQIYIKLSDFSKIFDCTYEIKNNTIYLY